MNIKTQLFSAMDLLMFTRGILFYGAVHRERNSGGKRNY